MPTPRRGLFENREKTGMELRSVERAQRILRVTDLESGGRGGRRKGASLFEKGLKSYKTVVMSSVTWAEAEDRRTLGIERAAADWKSIADF